AVRVRSREDLPVERASLQLLKRQLERLHMVDCVARGGVAGPEDPGQDLAAAAHDQRVEAEPALVVAGRTLLLGVHVDRRAVEVEDHAFGRRAGLPCALTGKRACLSAQLEL